MEIYKTYFFKIYIVLTLIVIGCLIPIKGQSKRKGHQSQKKETKSPLLDSKRCSFFNTDNDLTNSLLKNEVRKDTNTLPTDFRKPPIQSTYCGCQVTNGTNNYLTTLSPDQLIDYYYTRDSSYSFGNPIWNMENTERSVYFTNLADSNRGFITYFKDKNAYTITYFKKSNRKGKACRCKNN